MNTLRASASMLGWCLVAGALLLAGVPAAGAHPFSFDTAKMVGFKVVTAEDGAMKATDMAVIEYTGPIVFPMAENLRQIWTEIKTSKRFHRVVLRLNSPGGTDIDGLDVISVLREMRQQVRLITLVNEHDLCASMCVPIYLQGETRYAGPATSWMFHGAAKALSNVPSLAATQRYFDLFKERKIDSGFIRFLFEHEYVTSPGGYWISGHELAGKSNIITTLLPNWQPQDADQGLTLGFRSF
jgi:ATP-dependent protease ClpP protease subunit